MNCSSNNAIFRTDPRCPRNQTAGTSAARSIIATAKSLPDVVDKRSTSSFNSKVGFSRPVLQEFVISAVVGFQTLITPSCRQVTSLPDTEERICATGDCNGRLRA